MDLFLSLALAASKLTTQISCLTTIPFLRSVNKYTKISTHFQQLLATAGSVKSQRCLFTQSHADHVIDLQDERSLRIAY